MLVNGPRRVGGQVCPLILRSCSLIRSMASVPHVPSRELADYIPVRLRTLMCFFERELSQISVNSLLIYLVRLRTNSRQFTGIHGNSRSPNRPLADTTWVRGTVTDYNLGLTPCKGKSVTYNDVTWGNQYDNRSG